MKYLFDTSAWVSFLDGSPEGKRVEKILADERHTVIVADALFAEVFSVAFRKGLDVGEVITDIRQNSEVFEIYTNIWVEAAAIKERMRRKKPDFGLMDGLLLAVQRATGATIVTGDQHFKGLPKVMML